MPRLTAIDVLGVQDFVFASNRLKDAVAASWIVDWATRKQGAMRDLVPSSAQVLLQAGGNAIIVFKDSDEALSFASRYTRRIYDEAPGLEVVVCHRDYRPGELASAMMALKVDLARAKSERRPSAPTLGISVTASCRSTGMPACSLDLQDDTVPLSRFLARLRNPEIQQGARQRWTPYLKDSFGFPSQLDDMGRTRGEVSFIGVVHVDGNGVGQKIEDWLCASTCASKADGQVCGEYSEWSDDLDKAAGASFRAVAERTHSAVHIYADDGERREAWLEGGVKGLNFQLNDDDETRAGRFLLPLRPILIGGDDLTFVCDGRIALDLAETALKAFSESKIRHLGKVNACAGVAIVRAHAPFGRAYALAERLCSSAKQLLRGKPELGCALDWHVGEAKPSESIGSVRRRQYSSNGYRLTCRPYRLGTESGEAGTWRWLSDTLLDGRDAGLRGPVWAGHRNKVRDLEAVARDGPSAVERSLRSWRVAAKGLRMPEAIMKEGQYGFIDETSTPLIDAIELLDLHLPLDQGGDKRDALEGRR